ncbi:MAG: HlyD family efflux transporter periplasmic adaptor subunit [Phycisphaerae bacterium]|nr:HlyD family efflux transporter periplasmic adaptor subunit [Phycisphaerae bacterium]
MPLDATPSSSPWRRIKLVTAVILGVASVAITGVLLSGRRGDDSGASDWSAPASRSPGGDRATARQGNFDVVLPVSGELAALRKIEIRNKLEGRAIITEIAPEGKRVAAGDLLIKLAEEELITTLKDAEDKLKTAQGEVIAAEQNLSIKEQERQSELDKADVAVRMADLGFQGWLNGDVVKKRQELATALETNRIDAERLARRFDEAKSLVEKGFISRDDYEKDRVALIQANAKVKQAEIDIKVYDEFQFPQDEAKKQSDLEQARADRGRTEQKKDAELVKSRTELDSARFKQQTAQDRLDQTKRQIAYCTVVAPSDGLVVYASSIESGGWGRGTETPPPQAGTELKPNELVMILPDTSAMVANLKVNEALSGRIKPGQRVTVFSDATPGVPISGEVLGVSVLAESGGWRDPNRRDYTVRVALEQRGDLALKPSMRCKAQILLDEVREALSVPVQAVFRKGRVSFVYVPDGGGFAQKLVRVGRTSEIDAEIVDGLSAGDIVLLREPRADEITSQLPADVVNPPAADHREARGSADAPSGAARQNQTGSPESTAPTADPAAAAKPGA